MAGLSKGGELSDEEYMEGESVSREEMLMQGDDG